MGWFTSRRMPVASLAGGLLVAMVGGGQAPLPAPLSPGPPEPRTSTERAPFRVRPAGPGTSVQLPPGFSSVSFASSGSQAATLTGYLRRPDAQANGSATPAPAIVALHGCGGLLTRSGRIQKRELDWAERFAAAGYVVLFPDSFNPRGFRQVCNLGGAERTIHPGDRAYDAVAAYAWLTQQAFVDGRHIALIGWSNGGSTVLRAVATVRALEEARFSTAIAFYPGCRPMAESRRWQPRLPLTILIGSADDWTPPEPCRVLAQRHAFPLIEYPGAVHAFDTPDSPVRVRTDVGLSARGDGRVSVGTNPEGRAKAIVEVERILAESLRLP